MTTRTDEQGRPVPRWDAGETETLLGFLDFHRATFAWRCSGLDAEGLARTVGVSTMTLGGMLAHLAFVEEWWFSHYLHGRPLGEPWCSGDWDNDRDYDWHWAAGRPPEELRAFWQAAVERARADTAAALRDGGLDRLAAKADDDGWRPSLRWILCHLVEEYARHNGHADLLREAVDGQVGE